MTSILTRIKIDMHTKKNQISVFMLLFNNYYSKSTIKSKKMFLEGKIIKSDKPNIQKKKLPFSERQH